MSVSWRLRKTRLASLLKSTGDEDADGIVLDRLMHGQSVIGKTSKTKQVDELRFRDNDLSAVGTLEYGQYGVIDVVTCRLNGCVYVRKSIEKRFALRTRDQCFPQFERDILLQATKTASPWAPHLLCAFQTPTHLNLVMDYAEGGTLWDVLESSPHDGRILESDLRWWIPQVVSAIHWCHSQGFAHRDIKPHNFVLTSNAHLLLIDFGSAAPLLPPNPDGTQLLPKQYCLVPCGTCDYISPEILQAHEEALVALEMEDEDEDAVSKPPKPEETEGYGVETDWWSLGAMLYEMAYGVAPFFASDIRSTYIKIMNHEKSLRFDQKVEISHEYQHFLRRLLTHANKRLGRRNVMEITDHPLFEGVDWVALPHQTAPEGVHLPQFTYTEPKKDPTGTKVDDQRTPNANPHSRSSAEEESHSQGFPFSAFFQTSSAGGSRIGVSPGLSLVRPSPGASSGLAWSTSSLNGKIDESAAFIGFSWGPLEDAFPEEDLGASAPTATVSESAGQKASVPGPTPQKTSSTNMLSVPFSTPLPMQRSSFPSHLLSSGSTNPFAPSSQNHPMFTTPSRPYALALSPNGPFGTLPRTSTIRRTLPRRNVSDREAMKQLVECVGMSARKKVLESGRKPRLLGLVGTGRSVRFGGNVGIGSEGGTCTGTGTWSGGGPIPFPDLSLGSASAGASLRSRSGTHSRKNSGSGEKERIALATMFDEGDTTEPVIDPVDVGMSPSAKIHQGMDTTMDATDSEAEVGGPPSPSPSPRPGSAMSMISMSRRSVTPTVSLQMLHSAGLRRERSGSGSGSLMNGRERSGSGSGNTGRLSAKSAAGSGKSQTPSLVQTSSSHSNGHINQSAASQTGLLTIPLVTPVDPAFSLGSVPSSSNSIGIKDGVKKEEFRVKEEEEEELISTQLDDEEYRDWERNEDDDDYRPHDDYDMREWEGEDGFKYPTQHTTTSTPRPLRRSPPPRHSSPPLRSRSHSNPALRASLAQLPRHSTPPPSLPPRHSTPPPSLPHRHPTPPPLSPPLFQSSPPPKLSRFAEPSHDIAVELDLNPKLAELDRRYRILMNDMETLESKLGAIQGKLFDGLS